jgi:hypothetical protein
MNDGYWDKNTILLLVLFEDIKFTQQQTPFFNMIMSSILYTTVGSLGKWDSIVNAANVNSLLAAPTQPM